MQIDVAKSIYDKMVSRQLVMSYMGKFDHELLKSLINLIERKLTALHADDSVRRKILHFIIGCAQNFSKMEMLPHNNEDCIFLIEKSGTDYIIHLGARLGVLEIAFFKKSIDKVNSLDTDEVKSVFYDELSKTVDSYENYMMMSLLDIAKRTRQKISYDVINLNETYKFLVFKIQIAQEVKV
ncbi:MAG: DUF6272 family protein [Bacteroidia bacterium]